MKTKKSLIIIPTIIITFMMISLSSCTCSKNLESKCILKEEKYQDFVKTHGIEDDVNEFLYGN
jgi:hypothetical protein